MAACAAKKKLCALDERPANGCPEAKRFHERKKAKTNNVVATKALAHKLARACYHILKEGKPFDVTRCFA